MTSTFYNFSTGIAFLPHNLVLLILCGPPDLSAFLCLCICMYIQLAAHRKTLEASKINGYIQLVFLKR